ncbi:MAG: methyltransferase domain-containing protein [Taibaiella sp.]|nr:methyltransferase domain-containing protein [Taibaiella sp.]
MPDTKTKKDTTKVLFDRDKRTILESVAQAQFIAFAPYVFQASVILRDSGALRHLEQQGDKGATINEIAAHIDMSHYAARVLLEASLGIGLAFRKDGKYYLTKTGDIFINNRMTRINTDFMRDVCYDGAQDLKDSLTDGKPRGLRHLGDWDTIYQGLDTMRQPARNSWFAFDHHYSDNVFREALSLIFEKPVTNILDIGANTGKWALQCLAHDPNVRMGLVDLPGLLGIAEQTVTNAGYRERVTLHPTDMLDTTTTLPAGYDVIFMSQFLACFADEEILAILQKCHRALPENGRIFVNDTFWDRQRLEASAFSLQMTSLYFTSMANGNSQMYDSEVYVNLIKRAGFEIVRFFDKVGYTHTLFELRKSA